MSLYDVGGNVLDVGGGDSNSVFQSKTAVFFGDSITEQNSIYTKGYHQWIKELLGLSSYTNDGHSGANTEDVYNRVHASSVSADIVFVMCGINDQTKNTPLGQMGDSTLGTTYGNLDNLCSELKTKFPLSKIVFITPTYQTAYVSSLGITSYDVTKAIKEVAEKYTIPVYDNFVFSEIYATNLSTWTTDGCHWRDATHEMVGKNISKWMIDNFRY